MEKFDPLHRTASSFLQTNQSEFNSGGIKLFNLDQTDVAKAKSFKCFFRKDSQDTPNNVYVRDIPANNIAA